MADRIESSPNNLICTQGVSRADQEELITVWDPLHDHCITLYVAENLRINHARKEVSHG